MKYENLAICLVSFHVTVSKSHFAPLLQQNQSKVVLVIVGKALKSFLTAPLTADVYTPSHPGLLTPRDKVPDINWIEVLVGLHCGAVLNERIRTLSCECTYLNYPRRLSPSAIQLTNNKLLLRAGNDGRKLVTLQLRISFRPGVCFAARFTLKISTSITLCNLPIAQPQKTEFFPLRQIRFRTGTWIFFILRTAKFSVEDRLPLCPGSFEDTFQFTRGSSFWKQKRKFEI